MLGHHARTRRTIAEAPVEYVAVRTRRVKVKLTRSRVGLYTTAYRHSCVGVDGEAHFGTDVRTSGRAKEDLTVPTTWAVDRAWVCTAKTFRDGELGMNVPRR